MALTETEGEPGSDTNMIQLPEGNEARIIELSFLGPPEAA